MFINSKLNPRLVRRKVYLIINVHNALCWKLKQFNDFWKFHLISELIFFLIMIWFYIYEIAFDIQLALYNRLFLCNWLMSFSTLLSLLIYMVFIVSQEVRASQSCLNLIVINFNYIFLSQNHCTHS